MTDWTRQARETVTTGSPIWIRVRDAFTGSPPQGPLTVTLERRVQAEWVAFTHRLQITAGGDLALVGLGRCRDPATVDTFTVRITVHCPGTVPEAPDGDAALVRDVSAWSPHAPVTARLPDALRLYPGPGYRFPAGTPLVSGRVTRDGAAADRARVWVTETVHHAPVAEEVRTGSDGRFRLPVRWSAGVTTVNASHGGHTGTVVISVPDDLSTTQQITLT